MLQKFDITTKMGDIYEITADVKKCVEDSGIKEGLCVVYTPHTTAAIVVTSRMDPSDAAGHIKCTLLGVSMTFIVTEGRLLLGGSQGIFFDEFDGPRKRNYYVKVVEG